MLDIFTNQMMLFSLIPFLQLMKLKKVVDYSLIKQYIMRLVINDCISAVLVFTHFALSSITPSAASKLVSASFLTFKPKIMSLFVNQYQLFLSNGLKGLIKIWI